MPIRYAINPDLDLLMYKFWGDCTSSEYFDLYHYIYEDKNRHHGMKVLVDLTNAALDLSPDSLKMATSIIQENKENQFPPDHLAVLTSGSTFNFLADALVIMTKDVQIHLEIFHTIYDSIRWLGLAEWEEEALQFWKQTSL